MTRKKIGIVLAKPPGYSETFFRSKIVGLQKNGFQVELFCQDNEENFNLCPTYTSPPRYKNVFLQLGSMLIIYLTLVSAAKNVINLVKLERAEGTGMSEILKKIYLNAHLIKSELDWVHFGFATLALKRELIARAIGAKMAVSFRGFDLDVYPLKDSDCYSLLWKKIDKVHSISRYLLNKAHYLGMPTNTEYEIIYPAVDQNLFGEIKRKTEKAKPLKIVTIARLHWIKGIDLLIKTAQQLKQENIGFEWVVIGGGEQKEEERYLFHIYEANLVEEVKLVGKLSHLETLKMLREADIYVQTSWSEGFCNALLEAQGLEVPSLAFEVGGIPENIEDQKTGWLVRKISSGGMVKKLIEVMELPNEELAKVAQAAKERVTANFTIEEQQQKFIAFYS